MKNLEPYHMHMLSYTLHTCIYVYKTYINVCTYVYISSHTDRIVKEGESGINDNDDDDTSTDNDQDGWMDESMEG